MGGSGGGFWPGGSDLRSLNAVGTFETSDGVKLDYTIRGSGPVLYACHGGPANVSDTLARCLTPLEDFFTVVFHDYRGSGRSANAPSTTYTFERIADDLDELRRHLGHEAVPVLAHSMGGFVALNFALRHPDGCSGLALIGTTPTGDPTKIAIPALKALGFARTAKVFALAVWYLLAWSWRPESTGRQKARYAFMAATQEGVPAVRERVEEAMSALPVRNDNVPQLEALFGRTDLTGRLSEIRCPVLVLYGDRDALMVAGGQLLKVGLPQASVVVLPRVGHEPFLEDPEATFPTLRNFLGGL